MGSVWQVGAIVWKDVVAELRTKEMFSSMFVFAILVILVFNFAFELRVEPIRTAPGVLWVAFTFAGVLGLNRSFIVEKDKGCLEGLLLTPADRSVIYFGKLISNVIFMSIVEVILLPIFWALFNLPAFPPVLAVIIFLGTLAFAEVGTLFSVMVVNTRAREVLLPVLLFPIVIPALIAAVKATGGLLDGLPLADIGLWLQLLIAFDVIFLALAYVLFDYAVEE